MKFVMLLVMLFVMFVGDSTFAVRRGTVEKSVATMVDKVTNISTQVEIFVKAQGPKYASELVTFEVTASVCGLIIMSILTVLVYKGSKHIQKKINNIYPCINDSDRIFALVTLGIVTILFYMLTVMCICSDLRTVIKGTMAPRVLVTDHVIEQIQKGRK